MQTLLIATHNRGKLREYQALLADLPLKVINLDEAGVDFDVEETGTTFAENALLKARAYAAATGLLTWADDSGLEVDALDGAPGVYSARYAGPDATDEDRYRKLLHTLAAQPGAARPLPLCGRPGHPGRRGTPRTASAPASSSTSRGSHGFGYDPVFFLPDLGQTMAELPPATKNRISHRSRAQPQPRPCWRTCCMCPARIMNAFHDGALGRCQGRIDLIRRIDNFRKTDYNTGGF
ncbi:MAG: non-canonical purine NTP pyrophosphatase [Caldilineaceae bacterium]|nr:non-canonical purine NTP pyrophosphatase [Caldilineaceae bacterium]